MGLRRARRNHRLKVQLSAAMVDSAKFRAERDAARAEAHNEKLIERLKETDVRAAEWLGILEKMERERDEARAEVERLRKVVAASAQLAQEVVQRAKEEGRQEARLTLEWGPDVGFCDWHVAQQIAEDHRHNGWRLPTLAELTAQFDYATCKPRGDGWLPEIYWAAEACADVYAREADTAWALWFKHGDQVRGFKDTQAHRVRLVRARSEASDAG